jgi:hypothetical protein
MPDLRVAKPRVGVQIWLYPADIMGIMTDHRIISEVLEVATDDELRGLTQAINMEFDRREHAHTQAQRT